MTVSDVTLMSLAEDFTNAGITDADEAIDALWDVLGYEPSVAEQVSLLRYMGIES